MAATVLADFFDDLPFFAEAVFEEAFFVEVVAPEAVLAPAFFGAAFFGGELLFGVVADCASASEPAKTVNRKSKRPFFMRFGYRKERGAFHCPLCIVRD